jgi:anti-anti-sigma regulatory factor
MLMITCFEGSDTTLTLRLEGKLLEPWIGELQAAYDASRVPPDRVRLDLRAVTFMDSAGARYLDGLIRDGARVIGCSAFVAELLQIERR